VFIVCGLTGLSVWRGPCGKTTASCSYNSYFTTARKWCWFPFVLQEVMGKERLAKILQSPITTIAPDGAIWVDRHEIFDNWTRVRNEWTVVRNGKS